MRFLLCGLFAVLPSVALAQAEQLLAPIPPGFTLGHEADQGNNASALQEWVPRGESVTDWSQMLTIRIFRQHDGADPAAFHGQMAAAMTESCPGGEQFSVTEGVELGTPFHLMIATCPNSPVTGGPENFLSKAMGGQDALYIVQGAWRGPLSEAEVTQWTRYLSGVTVCDSRRAEASCPG
ncbi:hypothetical protein [Gymnodinialimonas ulvae]|uniref:hypothetical protein n=1 Tax=Gymnodinialimonas ulvae TaxID=3126504 RepID=UPI0030ABB7C7